MAYEAPRQIELARAPCKNESDSADLATPASESHEGAVLTAKSLIEYAERDSVSAFRRAAAAYAAARHNNRLTTTAHYRDDLLVVGQCCVEPSLNSISATASSREVAASITSPHKRINRHDLCCDFASMTTIRTK
jgi:hypothetical protein